MRWEKSVSRRVLLGTVGGITGGLVVGGVAGWLLKPVEHEVRTVTHTQTVGAPGVQTLTVTERITETLTRTLTAGAPREKVTITVNWFPGPESDAVVPIIDWWNKNMSDETGVRVELTLFGRAEHFEKIKTLLLAQSPEPDIVFMSYTVGAVWPHLEPLDDWFASPKYPYTLDHYVPAALDAFRVNGKLYGIPTDMNTSLLIYRTDLMPEPPKTLDEMVEMARKFTKKYNPNSPTEYGFAIQGKNIWFNSYFWINLYVSQGGVPPEPGKERQFAESLDSPTAIKVLQVYVDMYKEGLSPPDSVNYEYAETNAALASGKVAMALQWNAALGELRDPQKAPLVHDKMGAAPTPGRYVDGKLIQISEIHVHGPGINKYSKKKEAAFKFFAFLTTLRFCLDYLKNGGFTGSAAVLDNQHAQKIRAEIPELAPIYKSSFAMTTHPDLVPMHDILTRNINSALVGAKTPEQALKDAKTEILSLLKSS
jgi:multiple sugar transport system substrate-binding protein